MFFGSRSGLEQMAPKANYTRERLVAAATRSALKARADYSLTGRLSCEPILTEEQVKRFADVTFRWRFQGAGYDAVCDVTARCHHALERGVPLPDAWPTALRSLSLDTIAEKSAEKIRESEPGLADVECRVLGHPVPSDAALGRLEAFCVGGDRVMYFLCAPVSNGDWLVHPGTYKDSGELDEANPFDEKDLILKNLVADAWDQKTRTRLRTSPAVNVLRGLVEASDYKWRLLLGVAAFRAEERRGSALDLDVACRGFERNPFRWQVAEGWRSQARITCLWQWRSGLAHVQTAFVTTPLNNYILEMLHESFVSNCKI